MVGWRASNAIAIHHAVPIRVKCAMNYEEFRSEMNSYHQGAKQDAKAAKNPYVTIQQMRALFKRFDDSERRMAEKVLSEWVLSDDGSLRYDALALIRDFKVVPAMPAPT